MSHALRIAVADDEPVMCEYLQVTIPLLGHEVVATARTGRELVDLCRKTNPDLVISDIKMPELDGIEAAIAIGQIKPVPVILVSAYHDAELINRAGTGHVQAYLVKPIKQADLEASIGIAMQRFNQFQALLNETDGLRQALEDRKLIERAKGFLMEKTSLSEQAAFKRMQKMASAKNVKLVEFAQMILTAEEAALPPDRK